MKNRGPRYLAVPLGVAWHAILTLAPGPGAYGEETNKAFDLGKHVGSIIQGVNEGIQQELDKRPAVREGMTGGINNLSDFMSGAATPEADEQTRRIQRDAVQMLLNPSRKEQDRAFNDMLGSLTEGIGGGSGFSGYSTPSYSGPSFGSSGVPSSSLAVPSTSGTYGGGATSSGGGGGRAVIMMRKAAKEGRNTASNAWTGLERVISGMPSTEKGFLALSLMAFGLCTAGFRKRRAARILILMGILSVTALIEANRDAVFAGSFSFTRDSHEETELNVDSRNEEYDYPSPSPQPAENETEPASVPADSADPVDWYGHHDR